MDALLGIFFFLCGLTIGSFLNVVILRYNTGRSIAGRSGCLSCSVSLTWRELLPVASFLVQGGRCRTCQSLLSWQYPLVELVTGGLFVGFHLVFFPGAVTVSYLITMAYWMVIGALLVIIVAYDLRHKIIPDAFVFGGILLAGCVLFVDFSSVQFSVPSLWAFLAGPLLALPFAFLWLVSRGRWMGLGDAKLAWMIGWLLGLIPGITALVFAFWIGAVVSVALVATRPLRLFSQHSGFTIQSEVPFAPFMILGTFIVLFWNLTIITFIGL